MMLTPYIPMLRDLPLLDGLDTRQQDTLLEGGRLQHYANGDVLFSHGEAVKHFYIILSGSVQLVRNAPDGSQKTLDILKSGQTLCESEIMDSCRSHRASGIAVGKVAVLEFPVAWVKQSAKAHHAFALNLLSVIAQQVHMAELEAEHQATMSAAQLVACFLQRLCVLYDFNPRDFELPYSKTLIASRLGMELETLSRAIAKLKEHGIEMNGAHVAIHDLSRIEEYVCAFCSVSDECSTHRVIEKKLK